MLWQCINAISITGGRPTVLVALVPLLMITGVLDFFEDRNRKKVRPSETLV